MPRRPDLGAAAVIFLGPAVPLGRGLDAYFCQNKTSPGGEGRADRKQRVDMMPDRACLGAASLHLELFIRSGATTITARD